MLMCIDVGNTSIMLGVFEGEELKASFRLNSKQERTSDEMGIFIVNLLQERGVDPKQVTDCIISSVVPKVSMTLTETFEIFFQITPLFVGPGAKTGISIRADNPKEVGADRIVNVAAAHELYNRSCIVIDFGTATTFDYVSADAVFQYTVIMPGLEISAKALTGNTAKLPQVELVKPESVLASNTVSGMQVGIMYGYIGAVEHTIREMVKELKDEPYIVSTGGLGRIFAQESDLIHEYNPNIAFYGMKTIYKKTKRITGDLVG